MWHTERNFIISFEFCAAAAHSISVEKIALPLDLDARYANCLNDAIKSIDDDGLAFFFSSVCQSENLRSFEIEMQKRVSFSHQKSAA